MFLRGMWSGDTAGVGTTLVSGPISPGSAHLAAPGGAASARGSRVAPALPVPRPPPFPRPRSDRKTLGRCGGGVKPAGRRLTPERVVPARAGGGSSGCSTAAMAMWNWPGIAKGWEVLTKNWLWRGWKKNPAPRPPAELPSSGPSGACSEPLPTAPTFGTSGCRHYGKLCSASGTRVANPVTSGPGWSRGAARQPREGRWWVVGGRIPGLQSGLEWPNM